MFSFSSTATKNFPANRLNAMNNMNATNVQLHASICESDANGKDQVTKVLFIFSINLSVLYFIKMPRISRVYTLTTLWKIKTATEHQENCLHPKKSGAEVMQALEATDATQSEDKKLFATLIELLSYEKIIFNGKLYCFGFVFLSFFIDEWIYIYIKQKTQTYKWNRIVRMNMSISCSMRHHDFRHLTINGWWRPESIMPNVIRTR